MNGKPETDIAGMLDATLLAAAATGKDVEAFAREAARLGCAAVCINPVHVGSAVKGAAGTDLRIASVAGFPLGASPVAAVLEECRFAMGVGATELDIVAPIWAAAALDEAAFARTISALLEETPGVTHKIILEIGLLTPQALSMSAAVLNTLLPEFAKTGTGYARPVTAEDVAALRDRLDPRIALKAAGGIRTRAHAESLVRAGASRLGTSRPAEIVS